MWPIPSCACGLSLHARVAYPFMRVWPIPSCPCGLSLHARVAYPFMPVWPIPSCPLAVIWLAKAWPLLLLSATDD